jgi:predicted N-formylglutamate amidohydrolase
MNRRVILTCEHAGNRVPAAFAYLFRGRRDVLASHRGWDPGSLELGKIFQRRLQSPLFCTHVTRLLVEPNRSLHHRRLFSEFTVGLDRQSKQQLIARYYLPHRTRVENWISRQLDVGDTVLHLSLHTFTPVLAGETRNADVGLLYDPSRPPEKQFAAAWKAAIHLARSDLRVRLNYPYLGKADGFTTYLRKRFTADRYAGIELEVNQRWLAAAKSWLQLARDLAESCVAVYADE